MSVLVFMMSVLISVAVLGFGIALTVPLRRAGLLRSGIAAQAVGFGPFAAFWLIGAVSGASAFSSYTCLEYRPLPNGQLLDPYGNEIPRVEAYVDCGAAFAGVVFFEAVMGAWFHTVPTGVLATLKAVRQ